MKIVDRKVSELNEAVYNPRKISEKQLNDLKNSIREFGFVEPVVVNKHKDRTDIVVGGHQRLKAAKELGMEIVPTFEVKLDEQLEKELNIRLNRNTGDWDFDVLGSQFSADELSEWGFSDLTMFNDEKPREVDESELDKQLENFENAETLQIVFYFEKDEYDELIIEFDKVVGESRQDKLRELIGNYEKS